MFVLSDMGRESCTTQTLPRVELRDTRMAPFMFVYSKNSLVVEGVLDPIVVSTLQREHLVM
jgi:hypothetical protein